MKRGAAESARILFVLTHQNEPSANGKEKEETGATEDIQLLHRWSEFEHGLVIF